MNHKRCILQIQTLVLTGESKWNLCEIQESVSLTSYAGDSGKMKFET